METDSERRDKRERRRLRVKSDRVNFVGVRSNVDVEDHGFRWQEDRRQQ